jgi:hypothetical protein
MPDRLPISICQCYNNQWLLMKILNMNSRSRCSSWCITETPSPPHFYDLVRLGESICRQLRLETERDFESEKEAKVKERYLPKKKSRIALHPLISMFSVHSSVCSSVNLCGFLQFWMIFYSCWCLRIFMS